MYSPVYSIDHRHCDDVVTCFNACFLENHNTRLIKGGEEPIYLPADKDSPNHRIIFTKDYYSSALHEIAHWCVAGEARRQLVDYGYWYAPDGRSLEQQKQFEQVEIRPQAVEWVFHKAAGCRFRVSADNLNGDVGDGEEFKDNIFRLVQSFCLAQGSNFPPRALTFALALAELYKTGELFISQDYQREII